MSAQERDFSVGSIKRQIMAQAVPLTVAQVVQLLYNVVDRIYIGHQPEAGDLALTGLGVTFPVIMLIAAFTNLFGTGGTVLFSIARGRRDEAEAEKVLGNVFALLAGTSVVLFALCYPLRRQILFLFGASETSVFYADQYLHSLLHAGHWPQRLHQRPGLPPHRNAHSDSGGSGEFGAGPYLHLRAGHGGAWGGPGHCAEPGHFRGLGAAVPHRETGHSQAAAEQDTD